MGEKTKEIITKFESSEVVKTQNNYDYFPITTTKKKSQQITNYLPFSG